MFTTTTQTTKIRFIPRQKLWDGTMLKAMWVKETQLSNNLWEENIYTPTFWENLFFFLYL